MLKVIESHECLLHCISSFFQTYSLVQLNLKWRNSSIDPATTTVNNICKWFLLIRDKNNELQNTKNTLTLF